MEMRRSRFWLIGLMYAILCLAVDGSVRSQTSSQAPLLFAETCGSSVVSPAFGLNGEQFPFSIPSPVQAACYCSIETYQQCRACRDQGCIGRVGCNQEGFPNHCQCSCEC